MTRWDDHGRPLEQSPTLTILERVLFAKITPNLAKIGLLSDRLRTQRVASAPALTTCSVCGVAAPFWHR